MKSINFEYLRGDWPGLADTAGFAELYVLTDPQSALVKMRCFVETLVGHLYKGLHLPIEPNANLMDRLSNGAFTSVVPRPLLDKLHAVRKLGNRAAHEGGVSGQDAQWLLKECYLIGTWFYLAHNKGKRDELPEYQEPQSGGAPSIKAELKQKNKALQEKLRSQNIQLEQALAELEAAREAELKAQQEAAKHKAEADQAKVQAFQQASAQATNTLELNEAETRKRLIDAELRSAGWDVGLNNTNTEQVTLEHEVDGQPTKTGIGYCDYVLWDDNGKPLAVVEAKRTRENAEKGRQQAKLYADSLEKKHQQRPVIFYTNGYDIWLWDDAQGYTPRKLYGYYGKDSLQYLIEQRRSRADLLATPIATEIAGRPYQIESITRVSERFTDGHRKSLVVQATGTGKTRVSIALAKRLLDAHWAKRVLFLCDRKELRKQAANAFNEFTTEPLYVVSKSKKDDRHNARIYISTYPGMMQIYEQFDVGYFDLIIADESHRSIYNIYGDLFKYFDALEVGLTATPVEMVARSTCRLFGCDYKTPTANYPLEQAVADHYLVPFRVVTHTTQFLREGIKGRSLTDEQLAELEDQGFDPNTLDFDAKSIDKAVFNKDTNRAILRNLMEKGLRDADGQLPGKSIVFARNIQHAELLAELFGEMYPQLGGNFCRVIHSKYEHAEELIDDFKGSGEKPDDEVTIAISVDMLDTGIDAPSVVNLVFAKPIKSKVKFWQMIGRGTRLCEHLYGPGQHKDHFLIFDHWGNFEYFEMDPDEDEGRTGKGLAEKLFETRLDLTEKALKKAEMDLFYQTIDLIKADIDALDNNCIAVRDNWRMKAQLEDLKTLQQFAPDTRELLRSEMAPLMRWRNIKGQSEALRWDQQITEVQQAQLMNPAEVEFLKLDLLEKVGKLSMHINQVRARADDIKEIQKNNFWETLTFDALERKRTALRSIIHLRDKGPKPPEELVPVMDVKEDEGKYETGERKTRIVTVDYEIFRQQVEKTLTPLFERNEVLRKIRKGEVVTEAELEQLNALVHTQNPDIDLGTLKEFFPDSSASLDQLLRTIVGMEAEAVSETFTQFIQDHHIHLNSRQQRFIDMLRNHICKQGAIRIEQLYEEPFTRVHSEGLEGVFPEAQADALVTMLKSFGIDLSGQKSQVEKTLSY